MTAPRRITGLQALQPSSQRSLLRRLALLLFLFLLGPIKASFAVDPGTLLSPADAFRMSVSPDPGTADTIRLHFTIAKGYYLYKDRITAQAMPANTPLTVSLPNGEIKDDPNFGRVEIYHDTTTGVLHVPTSGQVAVSWQGCAEAGVCFPPQTRTLSVGTGAMAATPVSSASGSADAAGTNATSVSSALTTRDAAATAPPALSLTSLFSGFGASDESMRSFISGSSSTLVILAFFALGMALAFTPCMLPMLPIVTTLIVGNRSGRSRGFALSCAFVLAMAVTYALLGVLAARAGANLQIALQTPLVNALMCLAFVALAFSMFGFYQLQLPAALRGALTRLTGNATGGTWVGAVTSGIVSALLVGPCMTAPLAGTLIYIADTGDMAWGAVLLFVLGLGMGLPLLVVSIVGSRFLPRPGAWMSRVNVALGFVLLGTALFLGQRTLPATVILAGCGLVLIALAWTLYNSQSTKAEAGHVTPVRVLKRSAGFALGLYGASALIGALAGSGSITCPLAVFSVAHAGTVSAPASAASASASDKDHAVTVTSEAGLRQALQRARQQGEPALADFTADWCTSCKTVDRTVFVDPAVEAALAHVAIIRVDVTRSDAASRELMATNHVIGPPTILLFDRNGVERRQQRIVGEFSVDDLLRRHPAG